MPQLNDTAPDFIDRRRRLIRWWPLTLLFVLFLLAGTWLCQSLGHPALANTSYVIDAVRAGTPMADGMRLSALLLALVISMLFFVRVNLLLFLHLAIRNGRCYQAIIRRLRRPAADAADR